MRNVQGYSPYRFRLYGLIAVVLVLDQLLVELLCYITLELHSYTTATSTRDLYATAGRSRESLSHLRRSFPESAHIQELWRVVEPCSLLQSMDVIFSAENVFSDAVTNAEEIILEATGV